jgi:GT2 family glycosyltransferase
MSRAAALNAMRARLMAAIDRHGFKRVIMILAGVIFRYGLLTTIRLGRRERPFPGGAIARPPGVPETRPVGPGDLDQRYSLDVKAWGRWERLIGSVRPTGDPKEEDYQHARLTFVIQDPDHDPGAAQRTRAAIAQMSVEAGVWVGDRALDEAERDGRFIVFLKAGDLPSRDMPGALARAARRGVTEVISFDLCRPVGDRIQPLLLPGANPTLLQATDYVFSRLALRGDALPGRIDPQTAAPRDWVLAWMQGRPATELRGRWRHVSQPLVLAAIRDETISAQRQAILEDGRRPVRRHGQKTVSVVICTRDKGHLTRQLVGNLLSGRAPVEDVVIVSNGTANPYALQTLADLERSDRVTVLHRDTPFNFSKLSNAGVRASRGEGPILFLNDDITPVSEDWLDRLLARLDDPSVGSVGPLLLYPDERVQHAGMYLGHMGTAGHILRGARLPEDDYLFTAVAPREVACLTGAVLLTPRLVFNALNGFDEQLATHLQDVDYGIRLNRIGLANVFEPASVLIHMESASIRAVDHAHDFQRGRQAERQRFSDRWGPLPLRDRLHPGGFDLNDETLHRLTGPSGERP